MKILVVDDEPATTYALAKYLRKHGYEVVEAHNALDAVDQLHGNTFHAAIIDWSLPGTMSGIEVGKIVRRQGIGTFLMSGHSLAEMRAGWRDPLEGFLQFYSKPLNLDILLEGLEVVRRSFEGTKP